ncbi:MAG TPA: hypothetical protein ENN73_01745 [Firmicutes bacterium]|nr:hypothetical protein [Bacillota bacterium]
MNNDNQVPPVPPVSAPGQKVCPKCGSANLEKVTFTWWGGILGPKIYDIHRCRDCRTEMNGKTGQPIAASTIIIYTIIAIAIVIVVCGGCNLVLAIMEGMN